MSKLDTASDHQFSLFHLNPFSMVAWVGCRILFPPRKLTTFTLINHGYISHEECPTFPSTRQPQEGRAHCKKLLLFVEATDQNLLQKLNVARQKGSRIESKISMQEEKTWNDFSYCWAPCDEYERKCCHE